MQKIDINQEVYKFMDMVVRNVAPIKTIEKWIKQKSKGWQREDKVLFRKIIKEKLAEYIKNNFN